jgi:hypothetical protein
MLTVVPSLGTGEVFAFGAGVPLPTRMKFRDVPVALRPTSEAGGNTHVASGLSPDRGMIDNVIDRWRAATMSKGSSDDEAELGTWRDEAHGREELARYQPAPPLQPTGVAPAMPAAPPVPAAAATHQPRPSILRRPLTAEPLGSQNLGPLQSRYRQG